MSNIIKRLKRTIVRKNEKTVEYNEEHGSNLEKLEKAMESVFGIVKGKSIHAMHYSCEKCLNMQLIYLERGLEEHDENHKPVPFTIRCRKCGGMMRHVLWNDDVYMRENTDIPMGAYYFANLPQYKCGVIRQRGVDDIEEYESEKVSEEIPGT